MRRLLPLGAAVLALSLVACSSSPATEGAVAESGEAISDGTNDQYTDPVAQAKADVVVLVTNSWGLCSGTLIAPRVALTARHCVRGAVNETNAPGYFKATTSSVKVGSEGYAPVTAQNSATGTVIPTFDAAIDAQSRYDTASDAALIILPEGSFITSGLFIERPSFNVAAPTTDFGAGFATGSGGSLDVRQIGLFAFLGGPTATGTSSYLTAIGPAAIVPGDSGGPLFSLRADGTRDVRGLSSSVNGSTSYFADTSSVYLRGWIASNAQDATRTSGWLARHGKVAGDFWYGEADYTGTCQPSIDPDCDYWVGAHDDCPSLFNPDQLEQGDNGIGDTCTPYVSGLVPSSGGNAGGYSITVLGSKFDVSGGTQITFGNVPGTNVHCATPSACTVTVPAAGYDTFAQPVPVYVTVGGITSLARGSWDTFTYAAGPTCTSTLTCSGVPFGFPHAIATCATSVSFYELAGTSSQELLGTGTTYTYDTDNVSLGAAACDPTTGSCAVINTYEASATYCGSAKIPTPAKCGGFPEPSKSGCSVGWRCCGTWECGVCT